VNRRRRDSDPASEVRFRSLFSPGAQERATERAREARLRGVRRHPATAEVEYTREQVEFGQAVSHWRTQNPGRFPSLGDYLAIVGRLGYVKIPQGSKVVPLGPGDEGYVPLRVML
jgi:hypothetical protein